MVVCLEKEALIMADPTPPSIFDPNSPMLKLFSVRQPKRVPVFFNFCQTKVIPYDGAGRTPWPTVSFDGFGKWNFPSRLVRLAIPFCVWKQCSTAPPAVFNAGTAGIVGSTIIYQQDPDSPKTEINTYQPGEGFVVDLTNNLSQFWPGTDFSGMQQNNFDHAFPAIPNDPINLKGIIAYVSKGNDIRGITGSGVSGSGFCYFSAWEEWPVEVYGFGFNVTYQPYIQSGLQNPDQQLVCMFRCGMWVF